jgi:hypothetical protein
MDDTERDLEEFRWEQNRLQDEKEYQELQLELKAIEGCDEF